MHQPARRDGLRRLWRAGLGVAAAAALAGCGFKMRGPLRMPFARLRVQLSATSLVWPDVLAQLQASGVQVETAAPVAGQPVPSVDVVFTLLQEQRERAVVGVTATGQVRELQLRHRVKFRVRTPQGRDLVDDTELLQERDLSFSESLVLGKEMEEALLYDDMQKDLVRQVIRRLAAIQMP
jgi:LPS-assembly lipoprotein